MTRRQAETSRTHGRVPYKGTKEDLSQSKHHAIQSDLTQSSLRCMLSIAQGNIGSTNMPRHQQRTEPECRLQTNRMMDATHAFLWTDSTSSTYIQLRLGNEIFCSSIHLNQLRHTASGNRKGAPSRPSQARRKGRVAETQPICARERGPAALHATRPEMYPLLPTQPFQSLQEMVS